MWTKSRTQRQNNNNSFSTKSSRQPQPKKAVGTEALAKENLQRNARDFRYPPTGFVNPVEYTLLYSMLSNPTIYPEQVMLEMIREQNFAEFLRVKPPSSISSLMISKQQQQPPEPTYSYAQCSALLYMTAERWPSPAAPSKEEQKLDVEAYLERKKSVPQSLCQAILQTVVRHATKHNLDREVEVRELLQPLQIMNAKKVNKVNVALLVPMYLGLGASIVTGAAVPLWIGYLAAGALTAQQAPSDSEIKNLEHLATASRRMADEGTTSLLDDMDDDPHEEDEEDDHQQQQHGHHHY